jgi:hypothetical protein
VWIRAKSEEAKRQKMGRCEDEKVKGKEAFDRWRLEVGGVKRWKVGSEEGEKIGPTAVGGALRFRFGGI